MTTEHNNPPAFPTVDYKQPAGLGAHVMTITNGMTLLDHFAGEAMQSLINVSFKEFGAAYVSNRSGLLVQVSYEIANDMLKERTKWIK